MNEEITLIILGFLVVGLIWWYQDKKRQAQLLSDRLHNAENNIVKLKNESR
jgi:hypothetical protein